MVTWLDSIFQVVLLQLFQHVQDLNCIKFFSTSIFRLINFSAMPNDVDRYGRQRERRVRSPSHCSGRSRSQSRRSRSRRSHSRRSRSSSRSRSRRSSYTRRSRKSRSSRSRSPRLKEYVLKVRRLDKQNEEIKVNDEESDSDRDDLGDISRSRRLMKVDVNNPLSAFEVKTKTKLAHIQASSFCKQTWNEIRGMDGKTGKFLTEDRPNPDDWQKMAKSDKIVKKWSGDPAFADTRLDDGLASVVPKNVSKEESQLLNTQKAMGALGHMVLSATEGYNNLYKRTSDFVEKLIGEPNEPNCCDM